MKNLFQSITPLKFDELLQEVIAEIGGEQGMENAIRQQKCTFIEDIIRVKKLLSCQDNRHLTDITTNLSTTFDVYYDLDLNALELKLAILSARLNKYMKEQVNNHNNPDIWR